MVLLFEDDRCLKFGPLLGFLPDVLELIALEASGNDQWLEVEPRMEAKVDFGQGAWVMVDDKQKGPHLFRIVLSHSRKGYSEMI
jgi:hypothetical protein